MIKTADFEIWIRFAYDGQPYYGMTRKGEPYAIQKEDYKDLEGVFTSLSLVVNKYIEKLEMEEKLLKARANLESMSKEDAMRLLSEEGKRMWVNVHNATGNCYRYCDNGEIIDVPMEGVWK